MRSAVLRMKNVVRSVGFLLVVLLGVAVPGSGQDKPKDPPKDPPDKARPKKGLLINEPAACKGYTLIASTTSMNTYLVDMEGRVVQTWKSDCLPGQSAYLVENGNLLRTGQVLKPAFFGGGAGGRVQEFTWDGKLLWDYTCSSDTQLQHHDGVKLPNGNVLINVWEKKSAKDAVAAGRRPETVGDTGLLSAALFEVQPTGLTTGKVVWEWHAWDHVVQEFDAKRPNHGDVGAHAELIDLNFGSNTLAAIIARPEELEKLRAIGYVGAAGKKGARPQSDWLHVNAIAYNAALDQIIVTVHEFSEFWIIDHGTTTAEAAGHAGGKHGKGGDLLYRWGNPSAYRAGKVKDQRLFGPHNAHWIAKGLPGEGHVLIFNNGMRRTGGAYSTVDEIVLPVDARGNYEYDRGKPNGPDKAVWSYAAAKKTDFYAPFISGAERLANGNTLICSGTNGTVFEVTPKDEVVWKYVNPTKGGFPGGPKGPFGGGKGGDFKGGDFKGGPPFGGTPKLGQVLPSFLQGMIGLKDDQKKELDAVESGLGEKLAKLLTDEQKKEFAKAPVGFDPGSMPAPGKLMAPGTQDRLKLTETQRKDLAELQKEADGKLDTILKDDQKKQFAQMRDFAKGFKGPPGVPFGGGPPGGFPGFGGPGTGLFRAPRYAPDYPALAGRTLQAGRTIEALEATPKESKDKGSP
jgi:Arylsulfotransferase (ASST)